MGPVHLQSLGVSEYVNPIGGRGLFYPDIFRRFGVDLYLADFREFKYATFPWAYQPNLSILDVLMWNSPSEIRSSISSGTSLTMIT